jgi:hypothetical protein
MYEIAFCWISIDMPEPTIVCGRGTGRSGIGMTGAFDPASSGAALATGALLAAVAGGEAFPVAAGSCLLSQAAEASKITGKMAYQRMRVD